MLNDGSIAIMTAHSISALLTLVNDEKLVIKEKLRCSDNSTLYCSFIHGSSWDALTFFGGTALGELLIWKKVDNIAQIIHRQFLHNGVIFCIDFNGDYLVRLWNVTLKHS